MNNIAKIILGVGIVTAVTAVVYTANKKETEPKNEEVENKEEKVDILEAIKIGAMKKATQILTWVIVHKDNIEAVATVLSLGAGIFSFVTSIKDFKSSKKIDDISKKLDEIAGLLYS